MVILSFSACTSKLDEVIQDAATQLLAPTGLRVEGGLLRWNPVEHASRYIDGAPKRSKYSSKYALTELLVCGKCGAPYKRCTWTHHGKKDIVWRCSTRNDYGKDKCPESVTIHEHLIHSAILKALSDLAVQKEYPRMISRRHSQRF